MDRRSFLVGSFLSVTPLVVRHGTIRAAQATPDAPAGGDDLPALELTLTDTGFEIPQPLRAGRYQVMVTNAGTSSDSHFALGKIPDDITDEQYEAFLATMDDTAVLSFEDIAFVGVPDWPPPGGSVLGIIDLEPGRYLLFDPISGRASQTVTVEGEAGEAEEPVSDLTIELREMEFVFPETPFGSAPMRWKLTNTGAMSHELAVLPVSPEMTEETFAHLLEVMMSLPEDATPPPGLPEFVYQPVTAIGILAPQHTSWLDVQLEPGHYLAVCMLPFGTGYPHALDGMYRLFEVQ
jgi:hypothetical protein